MTLIKDALLLDHPYVLQAPAPPELTVENAPGRYVLAPASVFGCDNKELGGWVGKIEKVTPRNKDKPTYIKFHDKGVHFAFAFVAETFKPLT